MCCTARCQESTWHHLIPRAVCQTEPQRLPNPHLAYSKQLIPLLFLLCASMWWLFLVFLPSLQVGHLGALKHTLELCTWNKEWIFLCQRSSIGSQFPWRATCACNTIDIVSCHASWWRYQLKSSKSVIIVFGESPCSIIALAWFNRQWLLAGQQLKEVDKHHQLGTVPSTSKINGTRESCEWPVHNLHPHTNCLILTSWVG